MNRKEHDDKASTPGKIIGRREVLKGAVVLGLGLSVANGVELAMAQDDQKETDPKKMPPQEGDWFVFTDGSKKGQLISDDDIPSGGPQVLAWPAEVSGKTDTPTIKVVRDGNSQNEVLLLRFSEDKYSADTKQYTTAGGVVAYAATCTHQCCIVSGWEADKGFLHCPCHNSEYNPLNHAKNQPGSPAPRPLPQLPLSAEGSKPSYPAVAAGFRTQVGCGPVQH